MGQVSSEGQNPPSCGSILPIAGAIGIGDLKGFRRTLTDKPLMVCYTHDHIDHVGGASAFDHAYVHPKDMVDLATGGGKGLSVEARLLDIRFIAERQKGVYPYPEKGRSNGTRSA